MVGDGVRLAGLGVAIGLAAAWWAARYLQGLLYGVQAHEPWLYAGLAAVLLAVSLVAVYLPARRASKVEPIIALRVQ